MTSLGVDQDRLDQADDAGVFRKHCGGTGHAEPELVAGSRGLSNTLLDEPNALDLTKLSGFCLFAAFFSLVDGLVDSLPDRFSWA
jgi:hypothetical protein